MFRLTEVIRHTQSTKSNAAELAKKRVADAINAVMQNTGTNRTQLADTLGVSKPNVTQILNNGNPRMNTLAEITEALGHEIEFEATPQPVITLVYRRQKSS